jgi:hypothetical protein
MKKLHLLKMCIITQAVTLSNGCTSPESAAKKVCEYYSKISNSTNTAEISGTMSECTDMSSKYQAKFEGEDLNSFSTKVAECTVGSIKLR